MFDIAEELKKLPDKPGVYLMKNDKEHIIYVGKAINLKNRVRQYFQDSKNHSIKVVKMVSHIASFEYIVTRSEMEALILECNLIKKYRPKYNILLKDDKQYPYIKINVQEGFPRMLVVRNRKKDGAKYFGPYTDAQAMWELVDIIKSTWPLRTCSRSLPRDIGKERPCLNGHIGKCLSPCNSQIDEEAYGKMVQEIISFLSGKYGEVIKRLKKEMEVASEALNFERAATLRNQISAIQKLEQKQNVTMNNMLDQDVIAFAKSPEDTLIQVYFVRQGKLVGREHFYLEDTQDEKIETIFRDFVVQFYANATFVPKEVIIERIPEELEVLEEYLSNKKGSKVQLVTPKKGVKHGLLELASKNAELTLGQFGEQIKKDEQRTKGALLEIQKALGLKEIPYRIEAYDISNTQGIESVGGMVVFEGGKPKKSDYRKFKIKSVVGPNDYGSMEEVLDRRIARLISEEKENSFSRMPNTIFMDGGKGQVSSAQKILDKYGLDIPVCGMVKDEKHRTRGLLYKGEEVLLPIGTEGFKLITRIQDEVHRFSIEYHKTLRSKAQVQSVLDTIKGVGKERKKLLMKHFKSIENLKKASVEEIKEAGIPNQVAESIYRYFHK
ncbi:excinuclease ABC subunit C [Sporanaerobium hydrogeniformans]|uniref:Excinuclease ABC subunit C n=1 Tax=Sporanaerobium hydrogeniformans TaxID=3072179 RepID=A0AC61DFR6_9FIRM|nr:excinuclease ABC subunit UvrC [Sporanaerobium hydrogeniformans]PHV72046.1 excinuclease ABC subunit C [Sporanaerobium hydrogeniformans]